MARKTLVEMSDCRKGLYIPSSLAFLDGREVQDCYRAEVYSDGTGRVFCYQRNSVGNYFLDENNVATVEYKGRVKIIPPSTIAPEQWREVQRTWVAEECSHG